jgi:hypothetical protein
MGMAARRTGAREWPAESQPSIKKAAVVIHTRRLKLNSQLERVYELKCGIPSNSITKAICELRISLMTALHATSHFPRFTKQWSSRVPSAMLRPC